MPRLTVILMFPFLILPALPVAQVIHPPGEAEERQQAAYLRPPGAGEAKLPPIHRAAPLDRVLCVAWLTSPEIRMAYNEWVAALERVPQAGALDFPRLQIGINTDAVATAVDMLRFQAEQMFPAWGKRPTRAARALREAEAAGWRFLASLRTMRSEVATRYAELLQARKRTRVEEENVHLAREVLDLSTRSFATGTGSRQDVMKNEIAVAEAETEARAAQIEERRAVAELNAAVSRPSDVEIGEVSLPASRWSPRVRREALHFFAERNPELAALAAELEARGADVVLARMERRPDFSVGLDYKAEREMTEMGGKTGLKTVERMFMAGITLPLNFQKIRAQEREAVAMHAAQQARETAARIETMMKIAVAMATLDDADRILADYRDGLIPRQRQLVQLQTNTYATGETPILDVLDSRRMLIQSERLVVRAEAERVKALAELEALAATDLLRPEKRAPGFRPGWPAPAAADGDTSPTLAPLPKATLPGATKPRDSGTTLGAALRPGVPSREANRS